jgi:hypothetical protein
LNYIKDIKKQETPQYIITEKCIKVDEKENIFILTTDNNLFKYNQQGIFIYKKNYNTWFSAYSLENNFYPIDDKVIYYDKKKNIRVIDEKGNTLDEKLSLETLAAINATQTSKSMPTIQETETKKYMDQNKIYYSAGNLQLGDFEAFKKYFEFKKQSGLTNNTRSQSSPTNWKLYKVSDFIGYDKDNNSYWMGKYENVNVILVITSDGDILDIFKNTISSSNLGLTLAPSGDIYFMSLGNGGVTFYKITRRW